MRAMCLWRFGIFACGTDGYIYACCRTHTYTHTHSHTHTHTHTHAQRTHIRERVCTHTHKKIHTRPHTRTTTHTQHSCMARGGRAFKEMRSVPSIFESYPKVRTTIERVYMRKYICLSLSICRSFDLFIYPFIFLFSISLSSLSRSSLSLSRALSPSLSLSLSPSLSRLLACSLSLSI